VSSGGIFESAVIAGVASAGNAMTHTLKINAENRDGGTVVQELGAECAAPPE
jgi:hypothetical protein